VEKYEASNGSEASDLQGMPVVIAAIYMSELRYAHLNM